jgi:hypothetical protein
MSLAVIPDTAPEVVHQEDAGQCWSGTCVRSRVLEPPAAAAYVAADRIS